MAKKYKCPYCGESFSSEDSQHGHIRASHRRPFAKAVRVHIRRIHRRPLPRAMVRHIRKAHRRPMVKKR